MTYILNLTASTIQEIRRYREYYNFILFTLQFTFRRWKETSCKVNEISQVPDHFRFTFGYWSEKADRKDVIAVIVYLICHSSGIFSHIFRPVSSCRIVKP